MVHEPAGVSVFDQRLALTARINEQVEDLLAGVLTTTRDSYALFFQSDQDPDAAARSTSHLPALVAGALGGALQVAVPVCSFFRLWHLATVVIDNATDRDRPGLPWMHWPQEHVVGTSVGLLIAGLRALSPLPDAVRGAILTEVSDGAWVSLQAQSASTAPTTLDDYFAQITNKTGAIMAATAWAGARIHCEDEGLLDQAYTFGAELGILSQLRNDLADFADPSRIAERASLWSSLPILYAHTLTAHPRQPQFKALLASRDTLDPARFTAFRELLIDMGALDYCTSVYAYHVDRAIKALSTWPATPYREALIAQVMPGKVEVRRKSP